jgi:tRNA pseudouridine synthase 10
MLKLKLTGYEASGDRASIDFKEVFKWITSPLFAEQLGLPPNLDSQFNIHCLFLEKGDGNLNEQAISRMVLQEIVDNGMHHANKRDNKWNKKKKQENQEAEPELKVLSVDQMLSKLVLMPRVIFNSLKIFDEPIASLDLTTLLSVQCSYENILVAGRYIKKSRLVSQTPWPPENSSTKVVTSVQDEISKVISPTFLPANGEVYLHASGREDVDVRMLGRGRPFILEVVNPKRAISCQE